MAPTKDPKTVTTMGRLSFPTFTAKAAYERSLKGQYPAADIASAAPDFQLLLEPKQLDKVRDHVLAVFFPYCVEQGVKGEKRDVLTTTEVADLTKQIKDADFAGPYNVPFKPVHEKTALLAPECVATLKVIGNKGVDLDLKAVVNEEAELAVPDPAITQFPVIKKLSESVHDMYPGCYVAVTLNLYAYHNGKNPGFSAGASTAVFRADAERFGGGVAIDEDEIFLD
jgi:hypothetical protein